MIELSRSRWWLALVLLIQALFSERGFSQTDPPEENLKEFEGRYEYLSGATIQIAASPRDGVLYAILDEAKYPLKRMSKGVFADRQGSRVVFEREETGRISGYRFQQEKGTNFFRRISNAEFPETMWYARRSPGNAPYQFKASIPPDL